MGKQLVQTQKKKITKVNYSCQKKKKIAKSTKIYKKIEEIIHF